MNATTGTFSQPDRQTPIRQIAGIREAVGWNNESSSHGQSEIFLIAPDLALDLSLTRNNYVRPGSQLFPPTLYRRIEKTWTSEWSFLDLGFKASETLIGVASLKLPHEPRLQPQFNVGNWGLLDSWIWHLYRVRARKWNTKINFFSSVFK